MSLFHDYTLTWPQVVMLKWSVLLIGIAIGTYWHRPLRKYAGALAIIGIALGLYLAFQIL